MHFEKKKGLVQPFFEGVDDCLEASSDLELSENAVQVAFDRLLPDGERLGNFFVCVAFGKAAKDLHLPQCQTLLRPPVSVFPGGISQSRFIQKPGDEFPLHP